MQLPLVRVLAAALCLLVSGRVLTAQAQPTGPATDYAKWTVKTVPSTVAAGGAATIRFDVALAEGWKMYALDSPRPSRGVELKFDPLPAGLSLRGAPRQAEPKQGYDPNFEVDVRYFEQAAWFEADVAVAADAPAGPLAVGGNAVFMICNATICLPPTRVPFSEAITVRAAPAAVPPVAAETDGGGGAPPSVSEAEVPPVDSTDGATAAGAPGAPPEAPAAAPDEAGVQEATRELETARAGGLWAFLLLAAGAGLAALLTPCVFPMIPLTVSFFTRHAGSRSASVRMALVYGASIVLTFTSLGVLMAVLVGAAGAQSIAANPWVNLFIGVVFVVFALSLLGLFELRLPSGLLNYFNRQSNEQQGYVGVLFMGLTLTLVSFSCTAPFVGGLLAATAGGEWSYPVLGMLVFSATFALPFVLFALFPNGLQALPRSGAWMNTVKVTLGFVELVAALKFLSNADLVWGWGFVSRPLAIALSAVVFALAGLYLIGKLRLRHEPAPQEVGVVQLLVAVLFFGLSLYLLPGLFGAPLGALDAYLPPRLATDVSLVAALPRPGGADDEAWEEDIEAAFARAREARKPVFIDFTGYTCTNCRQMEANVFPRPEVADRFRRDFVLLRLYTDDAEQGPALQRYQLQMTGTVALPTYAIVEPFGGRLLSRISGVAGVDAFVGFLDQGTTRFADQSLAAR